MNRWTAPLVATLAFAATAVCAQTMRREVPADVQAARLVITLPPQALLDGQPVRLSPGARIRNTQNLLLLSGNVAGQDLPVLYRRDALGLLSELWLLSEAEYKVLGGSTAQADARAMRAFGERLGQLFTVRQ